jgi:chromatin segregation and condensation protein Rec8/ScpA/Scc1 (kleisin family)
VTERTLDSFFGKDAEKTEKTEKPEQRFKVYLASVEGFKKYCEGCEHLAKSEETGSYMFPLRVYCRAEKCVK